MVKPKAPETDQKDLKGSREKLLKAARQVFAAKGYEGATVKDLADAAGVNISLVSYHFGGKENLYRACLESFGLSRVEAAERILQTPKTQEEFFLRLRLFVEEFIQIHRTEPDLCMITHRDIDLNNQVTIDLFQKVFLRVFTALENFVKDSQKSKLIRNDIKPMFITSMMFGTMTHFCKSDRQRALAGRPTLQDAKFVNEWVDAYLSIFRDGVDTSKSSGGNK